MSSAAQIAANRRNAQNSTGPRTPSGKAASRMNAMRSGLYADNLVIRGENACDLERLTEEYHREFNPVTPRERDLVDSMVRNEWIIRRMGFVEAQLWGHHFHTTDVTLPGNRFDVLDRKYPYGQAFIALSVQFERVQRRVSSLERATRRALHELAEIRAAREQSAGDEPLAESEPQTIEPTSISEGIGFVPSAVGQASRPAGDLQVALPPEPQSPSPLLLPDLAAAACSAVLVTA